MLEMCFSTAPAVTTSRLARSPRWSGPRPSARGPRARAGRARRAGRPRRGRAPTSCGDDLAVERGAAARRPAAPRRRSRPRRRRDPSAGSRPRRARRRAARRRRSCSTYWETIRIAVSGWRCAQLERGAQPLVGEGRRQADVDDRDVGLVVGRRLEQRSRRRPAATTSNRCRAAGARARPAGAPGPRRSRPARQLRLEPSVGPPGGLVTVSVPSSASTRRRSPLSPLPARVRAAHAVVGDRDARRPRRAIATSTCVARRVLGGVGERLRHDEVGGALDPGGGRSVELALHGHGDRAAPGSACERRVRARGPRAPAGGCRGPGRAARASASPAPPRASAHAAPARLGVRAQLLLGQAEAHAERDQPRLRAVVEVALDPAQLRRLDVDGAARRPGEDVDPLAQLALAQGAEVVPTRERR